MLVEKQYVEENRDYLLNAMDNAPEFFSGILAARFKTVRELFSAVLDENDYSYLPLCLYFIYNGSKNFKEKEIENNEAFALNSLLWIHEHGGSDLNTYVLAYALRYDLQLKKCEALLWTLEKKGFSPASIALGDLLLSMNKIDEALLLYKSGSELGHFTGWERQWEAAKSDKNNLYKMKLLRQYPILYVKRIYNLMSKAPINEHFLCLKFQFDVDFSQPSFE